MTIDQTVITALSAGIGALVGTGIFGYWLGSRFNNIYKRIEAAERLLETKIDDHEKLDLERFGKQDLAIMRIELALQGQGKSLHSI